MTSQIPRVIFFGSFLEYSADILKKLVESPKVKIIGVITTPPRPAGRKQILTKTHVHEYAHSQNIPVYTPEKLNKVSLDEINKEYQNRVDLFVVAGYGKLLPTTWLTYPKIAPINIHFSLLPKYRGAMPGEWALMMGEIETGVSLIEMSPELDTGNIFAQDKYKLSETDNRETVYQKLYDLGVELFLETVEKYIQFKNNPLKSIVEIPDKDRAFGSVAQAQRDDSSNKLILPPRPQKVKIEPYARLLSKNDSFIPWSLIKKAQSGVPIESINELPPLMQELPSKVLTQEGLAQAINRMIRGLYGWPGVWSEIETEKGKKRIKLHTSKVQNGRLVLDQVQIEGEKIKTF